MRIALLSSDPELLDRLRLERRRGEGGEVVGFEEPDELLEPEKLADFDAVIVSDRLFHPDGMQDYLEELAAVRADIRLIALLSNRFGTEGGELLTKVCIALNIRYTRPGLSMEELIRRLREELSGSRPAEERAGILIGCAGTTPNMGVTLLSFGSAVQLAGGSARSVGYLCLNLKSAKLHRYLGHDRPSLTLDAIRPELKANALTSERLRQVSVRFERLPNLHVLFGNQAREQAEYYRPGDIDALLTAARTAFDLCFLDVGAYWDNAATITGLMRADTRMLFTTPRTVDYQEDTQRWIKTLGPAFGLQADQFDVWVNRCTPFQNQARRRDIRRGTGMNVIGDIRYFADAEEALDQGRLLEYAAAPGPYSSDTGKIAQALMTVHGIEPKRPSGNVRRRWSFRRNARMHLT